MIDLFCDCLTSTKRIVEYLKHGTELSLYSINQPIAQLAGKLQTMADLNLKIFASVYIGIIRAMLHTAFHMPAEPLPQGVEEEMLSGPQEEPVFFDVVVAED